ncbi:CPCC family cysteine-rich protein [Rapidithrix thailandica]|uniref:CPCC family cysteine-rich protein n=1 Tax=Rapidithrix thailandica TaxID=413964 RepID=A0AAW9S0Q4_9BACT
MRIEISRKDAIRLIQDYHLLHLTIDERGDILLSNGIEVTDEDDKWLFDEILKEKYNETIRENFNYNTLVRNEYIELQVQALFNKEVSVKDSGKELDGKSAHACVCCGYKTSFDREFHNICPVCFWQDDFTEGDEYSSPNRSSLNDFREHFFSNTDTDSEIFKKFHK